MSSEYNNYNGSGIGFFGLLQLIFITLKLINIINWPWPLVLLPALISGGIILLIIFIALIALIIDMRGLR